MKLRALAAAITVGTLAAGLAACSTAGQGTATTLTLWHNSADSPALLQLYKDFEAASGIRIDLVDVPSDAFETTVLTKWATGERPDLLEYHPTVANLLALNPKNTMVDLTDMAFVSKSGDLYKGMGSIDGRVYAAITGFPSVFGMYYNKEVFKANGLEPPTSFGDLRSLCQKLKSTKVAPIWESGGSVWPTQVLPLMYLAEANLGNEYGAAVAANKQSLAAPGNQFIAALQAYSDLGKEGCFNSDATSATFEDGLKAVYNGTAAMTALHSDTYASLLADAGGDADALAAKVGFVPVSATKPVGTWAGGPLGTYFVPKTGDSAKEAAAKKFIEFATGDGYQKLVNDAKAFPVISTATSPGGFTSLQLEYQAAYEKESAVGFNSNIAGFFGFATETTKLLAGQTTPEDAAASMQTQVEQASKAAGVAGW